MGLKVSGSGVLVKEVKTVLDVYLLMNIQCRGTFKWLPDPGSCYWEFQSYSIEWRMNIQRSFFFFFIRIELNSGVCTWYHVNQNWLSAYICIIFCTENNIHMEVYFWPFIYEPQVKFIPRLGIKDCIFTCKTNFCI